MRPELRGAVPPSLEGGGGGSVAEASEALGELATQRDSLNRRLPPPRKGGERGAVAEREGEPLAPRQRGSPPALVDDQRIPIEEGVGEGPAQHAVQHPRHPHPHLLELTNRVTPTEERAVLDAGVNRLEEPLRDENLLRPLLALRDVGVPVEESRGQLAPRHAHSRAAQDIPVALELHRRVGPLGEGCEHESVGHSLDAVFQNFALPLHLAPVALPADKRGVHALVLPRQHEPPGLDHVHLPLILLSARVFLLGLDLIDPVVEGGCPEAVHDPNQHQSHNLALPPRVDDRAAPGSPRREEETFGHPRDHDFDPVAFQPDVAPVGVPLGEGISHGPVLPSQDEPLGASQLVLPHLPLPLLSLDVRPLGEELLVPVEEEVSHRVILQAQDAPANLHFLLNQRTDAVPPPVKRPEERPRFDPGEEALRHCNLLRKVRRS